MKFRLCEASQFGAIVTVTAAVKIQVVSSSIIKTVLGTPPLMLEYLGSQCYLPANAHLGRQGV